MILAIAALLLTSVKCSGEMLRALQALPIHADVAGSLYMRDAETGHMPVLLSRGMRHVVCSSK
jgi:hypothetical protein